MHVPKEKRKKLDKKSKKMIFIGYSEGVKGYRCIHPVTQKLFLSRDVYFLENDTFSSDTVSAEQNELDVVFPLVNNFNHDDQYQIPIENLRNDQISADEVRNLPNDLSNTIEVRNLKQIVNSNIDNDASVVNKDDADQNHKLDENNVSNNSTLLNDSFVSAEDVTLEEELNESSYQPFNKLQPADSVRRSTRQTKPVQYDGFVTYNAMSISTSDEPISVKEAMESQDAHDWKLAMN